MTDNEREELIFNVATQQLKQTSQAGIYAFALDRVCSMLDDSTTEQLLAMYQPEKKTKNNNYILTALNKCTSALQPGVSHSPCSYRDRACVGAQDGEDIAR